MIGIVIVVLSSFLLSVMIVGLVLRISHKKSWYDQIDERKIHTGAVPRLGGIGFALSFIISASFIIFFIPETHFDPRFVPVFIAMILTLVYGIFDDFRPLVPRYKLLLQIVSALCIMLPGYIFNRLFYFDIGFLAGMNWFWYLISLFWLVGLPNALNFIDGNDGLAGGVSVLIALSYALIFASFDAAGVVIILCVCLALSIGGFLVFNMPLPRAKIFMGDGGSQFLGFVLALLPLVHQDPSALPLSYAAALLLIPILDTTAAVWRRIREGRRIASPDRSHIHHKLMNLGFSSRGVDGMIYGLQIGISFLVFVSTRLQGIPSLLVLCGAYLIGILFFTAIHYANRHVMSRNLPDTESLPNVSSL
ncbi:MAG: undecaprenyl/decaprenyl-phosphate alpha-N-acetylglucosaminyl 1-phosphate transferase [Spirochaetaceae bacterium]|jgi:UDP-GlcNAc:undecaprenyl-phosphate GlcNAc-1-phosphate transferase|nr:undecaprenyl/decaprenyl-phosphate alpha-N-acetylglucosaminyl 1-phosphate transferase [Spirochaetaceae bacterium]